MSYQGERLLPLQLTAASQLQDNRVVKITSGVPAYPGYGDVAVAITRKIGDANDYVISVLPLDYVNTTFRLLLAGTVAAHAPLFATGAVGAVKTNSEPTGVTVKSRNLDLPASPTAADAYIVPTNSTQIATFNASGDITGAVAGDVVRYDGSNWKCVDGTTAVTAGAGTPTAGDIYYIQDEGIYCVWSGTAWVETPVLAYASEAGVSGQEIVCYNVTKQSLADSQNLKSDIRPGAKIVCVGQITIANTETSGTYHNDQILATDFAFVTSAENATNDLTDVHAVCSADTVTVTIADPGTTGATINIMVVRPLS